MSFRFGDLVKRRNAAVNPVVKPLTKPVVESLENRLLLSGTITISNGVVTVSGTTNSDTIAAGTNPANSSQYYFLVQTAGEPTVENFYAISSVTGLQIYADPVGSSPTGTDNDYINLGGTNFGFAVAVQGGVGSDTVIGQEGPNQITTAVGSSHNILYGGAGADTIVSYGSDDTIRGGAGANILQVNSGNNVIAGGPTGSQEIAGSGWDTLRSGRGNATLHGSQNADGGTLMLGGFGNDYLDASGSTNDTMIAGSGTATLVAGTGTHFMDAGWDSYLILQGGGTLPGATGSDLLNATGTYGGDTTGSAGALDTIVSSGGTPTLVGSNGTNTWALNNTNATTSNINNGEFVAENDTVNFNDAFTTTTITLTLVDTNGATSTDVVIPNGAGNSPNGDSAVRAINSTGTIVFQTNTARVFTLADFFNHWGVSFSSLGMGQFVASPGSGHSFSMTVNGVANTEFGAYQVQNGDNIVVTFTQ